MVDGTYYIVTSTFEYLPGIPVYAETAASFTGRVFGVFAVFGAVTFDGLRYTGSDR